MPTTEQLEAAVKQIAEATDFIRTRSPNLVTKEELARVEAALRDSLAQLNPPDRQAIHAGAAPESGPYRGLGHFELSLVKALREASSFGKGRAVFHLNASTHGLALASSRQENRILSADPLWDGLRRALDSTTVGAGDELVPTLERDRPWRDVHLNTRVSSFLPRIHMPSSPFDVPLELGDITFYKAGENVTVAESDAATAKNSMTAATVKALLVWSYELDEDSIIAMLPQVRELLVRNVAETIDELLLCADDTGANNINYDSGTLPNSSRFLYGGGDGLLHLPLVDNTNQLVNQNAAISTAMFKNLLAKLRKYALNPSGGNNRVDADAAFFTDIRTFLQALSLSEVLTVDKLGGAATLRTGQLASIFGVPLIVSGQLPTADTDGKVSYNGNGTETGRVLAVNRNGWLHGFRRELLIEAARDIEKTQIKMVCSFRMAMLARGTRSSAQHTALAYNITGV